MTQHIGAAGNPAAIFFMHLPMYIGKTAEIWAKKPVGERDSQEYQGKIARIPVS